VQPPRIYRHDMGASGFITPVDWTCLRGLQLCNMKSQSDGQFIHQLSHHELTSLIDPLNSSPHVCVCDACTSGWSVHVYGELSLSSLFSFAATVRLPSTTLTMNAICSSMASPLSFLIFGIIRSHVHLSVCALGPAGNFEFRCSPCSNNRARNVRLPCHSSSRPHN